MLVGMDTSNVDVICDRTYSKADGSICIDLLYAVRSFMRLFIFICTVISNITSQVTFVVATGEEFFSNFQFNFSF